MCESERKLDEKFIIIIFKIKIIFLTVSFCTFLHFVLFYHVKTFFFFVQRCCLTPSAPATPAAPAAPKDVLEALEQRRAKYVEASGQAKASGDDRKARMHDRIAKVSKTPPSSLLVLSFLPHQLGYSCLE